MIKKLTAYSLILLANIVLLAHAVIPHHHHESVVCVAQMHCQDDALSHKHSVAENEHQHGGNKDSTSCILKQPVLVPTSQGKHLKSFDNCSDTHNYDYFILSNFGYPDLESISKVVINSAVHFSYLRSFVTSTLGLRAPPTV